jgi:hypothetical protein
VFIARVNELAARTAVEQGLDDLVFQSSHAERIYRRLESFDQRFLDAYERMDALGYDERRATLDQFMVQVMLWKRDHELRYAIDWALDLGELDGWKTGEDDEPWIIFTRESMRPPTAVPHANSSG